MPAQSTAQPSLRIMLQHRQQNPSRVRPGPCLVLLLSGVLFACNSSTPFHPADGGQDVAPGTGGGGGTGGASATGGSTGTGGTPATGGKTGAGGEGGGTGGAPATGGMAGTGGMTGAGGGGGGSTTADASTDLAGDKPSPTFGSPCETQADCGSSPTFLFCLAPGESRGCGVCLQATSECTSDADCAPDGGGAGGKQICEPPPSSACYCSPVKLCLAGCRSDSDCGAGQRCNSQYTCQNTCVAGDGTCPVDFSCGASGFCERKSCTSDADCSVACVKGACYGARGFCEGPAA